jgi:CHAD domain-containing protein
VAVLNEDEKTVVRLVIREGRALSDGERGEVRLLPRLECHPLKGYGSEERQVLRFLRRNFDLEPEERSEEMVVFQALGEEPFDYSSAFDLVLDPKMPAAEATREVFRTLFRNVRMNHEGVLRDWDPEFLHDFRVAVRRTRSALTQIKGVLPEESVSHFAEEFRWLGSVTGPTRDLDVYLLNIPAYRKALGPEVGDRLEPLVHLLREKKREELRTLRRALRSQRFRRLVADWNACLDEEDRPEPLPPLALEPIRRVASDRISKVFAKVLKKGRDIGPTSPARKLHRLRIECKKLRYLLTFFESLYPADTLKPTIKELKRLQDHLGDFNDAQVQREALGRFAEELMEHSAAPPETLLAMGQLMGQLQGKQLEERNEFLGSFREFTTPEKRRRFQDMFAAPQRPEENAEIRGEAP